VLDRETYFKSKPRLCVGERPVPADLWEEANAAILFADDDTIRERIAGLKGR
jgi:hypothetical protein